MNDLINFITCNGHRFPSETLDEFFGQIDGSVASPVNLGITRLDGLRVKESKGKRRERGLKRRG